MDSKHFWARTDWREAKWAKGPRIISGRYRYYRPSDTFHIELDETDRTTGRQKTLSLRGYDEPEWGKWRIIR